MGLETGPLSLLRTTEELLGKKIRGSDLEKEEYDRRDPSADQVASSILKVWH
jgi:hypothetical protein